MSNADKIRIRNARAEDAPEIASLLVMAWPVEEFLAMDKSLTESGFIAIISGVVRAEGNVYSYERTIVAVLSDEDGRERIVGAMNGYDGADYKRLKQPVADTLERLFPGSGQTFAEITETEAGEYYLDSIGVDPSVRGAGIGTKLFTAMEERAKALGFDKVGLIVDEDKPDAERLYVRLGFEYVGSRDFLGHAMKHLQKRI